MICFLTSRVDDTETGKLFSANRFADELRKHFPQPCRALEICSDPDDREAMDYYAGLLKKSFEDAGFVFQSIRTLDGRNEAQAAELVTGSNLFILAGGHVPTQNRFFQRIRLRELLADAAGIVIGISAGSMNSAETVYAQPELDGETVDPDYQRFLPGLGLTKTMLLPHYQEIRDAVLDGLRVFEDIAYPDSRGKTFYAIPDGSWLLVEAGREELRGEAYRIRDGAIAQVSADGEALLL